MDGVITPSISSAVDETLAQLDRLFDQQRVLRERHQRSLDDLVARLGESSVPWTDESGPDPTGASNAAGQRVAPTPTPYVALPERTTHGGPFGPAVRAKLIAEALGER